MQLPGADLVERGLDDLRAGRRTVEALLVAVGGPKLRSVGIDVPVHGIERPEIELYLLLAEDGEDSAHSRYNALIRRLVSFERAAACAR